MRAGLPEFIFSKSDPLSTSLCTCLSERASFHILAFPPADLPFFIQFLPTWYWGPGKWCFLLFWFNLSLRQCCVGSLLDVPYPSSLRGRKWSGPRTFFCFFPCLRSFYDPLSQLQSAYDFCSVGEKDSDRASGLSLEQLLSSSECAPHRSPSLVSHTAPHFLILGKVSREQSVSGCKFPLLCGSQGFSTLMVDHTWLLAIC